MSQESRSEPKPGGDVANVVVFVVDQMSAASLRCNGNGDVQTPNIDALAQAGTSFQRAYCSNPVCMPARAGLITGMTPRQHGCISNGMVLDDQVTTLPGVLADAGYRTHAVGKLHHQPYDVSEDSDGHSWEARAAWDGGVTDRLPEGYYGYQTADFLGGHGQTIFGEYANWLDREHPGIRERYGAARAYSECGLGYRIDVSVELHYNEWVADRACDFLSSVGRTPFFLWCSFPDPHSPFAATRPYSERYDPATLTLSPTWNDAENPVPWLAEQREALGSFTRFDEPELREVVAQTYGMISHVDACVGRVMRALEQHGLDNETVIVFVSDHGEYLGAHHLLGKSIWPYEDLLRVPFIWRAPGGRAHGGDRTVVSQLDLVPTILDYAGLNPEVFNQRERARSAWPGLPGRSLRAHLQGDSALNERPALVEYDEDWTPGAMTRMRALVGSRYKFVRYAGRDDGVLFDLEADPYETQNLWDQPEYAELNAELTDTLLERLTWSDPLPGPRLSGA